MKDYRDLFEKHNDYFMYGNGLSISFSKQFNYASLYDVCSERDQGEQNESIFTEKEIDLFDRFGTKNFEWILYALNLTEDVNDILGHSNSVTRDSYENIKNALIRAVHKVHVQYDELEKRKIKLLNKIFQEYDKGIFTTNYDLITYWTIMEESTKFVDFFYSNGYNEFDIHDTQVLKNKIPIYYLHGALHLYRESGVTRKIRKGYGIDLLYKIEETMVENKTPLFVSEGKSEQKLKSITSNVYLNFCYSKLMNTQGGITILGSNLGKEDKHIIDALNSSNVNSVAVSMFSTDGEINKDMKAQMSKIERDLNMDVEFFLHSSFYDFFENKYDEWEFI